MKTTIEIVGMLEMVLERAVEVGIARSKTDALRIGVLELNHHYHLVEDTEVEKVVSKMIRVERENREKGLKPETLEDVYKKYPHLRKIKG